MKKAILFSFMTILILWSCSNEELLDIKEVDSVAGKSAARERTDKILICHYEEFADTWKQISVHPNALNSHLAHGDLYDEFCPDYRLDEDNDGVSNDLELCPNTPAGELVDADGCAESQKDDDGDGVTNDVDSCPDTPNGENVNENGCSPSQGYINLLSNPSAEEGMTGWLFQGLSGVEEYEAGNNVFYTIDNDEPDSFPNYLRQDVNIDSNDYDKYILMIANTYVDNVVDDIITGHPYLWGYQQQYDGLPHYYMYAPSMNHSEAAKTWQIVYGIFQIQQNVEYIVIQLNQGGNVNVPAFGAKAWFDEVELIIFDTEEEAINYKDNIYTP